MYHICALTSKAVYSYSFDRLCRVKILVMVACRLIRQNMQAFQTVTNSPCQHVNAELLLVSGMDCALRILLCLLVLVV
jgi:hypothetical protein